MSTSDAAPSEMALEFAAGHCSVFAKGPVELRNLLGSGFQWGARRGLTIRSALPAFTVSGAISDENAPRSP